MMSETVKCQCERSLWSAENGWEYCSQPEAHEDGCWDISVRLTDAELDGLLEKARAAQTLGMGEHLDDMADQGSMVAIWLRYIGRPEPLVAAFAELQAHRAREPQVRGLVGLVVGTCHFESESPVTGLPCDTCRASVEVTADDCRAALLTALNLEPETGADNQPGEPAKESE